MGYNNYRNYSRNFCTKDSRCDCRNQKEFIDNMPLAMAYVPWQKWCDVYDLENAHHTGTIFPELNKPYIGRCI